MERGERMKILMMMKVLKMGTPKNDGNGEVYNGRAMVQIMTHGEPIEGLREVLNVICGDPPCQGISRFNRLWTESLTGPKKKQLKVLMDMVHFLRPRFVLMENVVDLLEFSNGFLWRHGLSWLVGMMAAGAYGLPQFRMRVFTLDALAGKKLPQYPLPTHNVVARGVILTEFELNTVAYMMKGMMPN